MAGLLGDVEHHQPAMTASLLKRFCRTSRTLPFAHAPIKGHIHLSHPKGADHLGNAKAIPPHHFMVGMIWNRHDETQAVIAIRRRWRMRRHERSEEHTSELQS